MIFILHIAIALTLVVAGAAASVFHWAAPELDKFSFLIGAVTAQFWLFGWALILRARRVPRFDMVVASELLIALGIFSLITGIVISGVAALHDVYRLAASPWRLLQTVLVPFGEGLFASGLAPLLASMLRQIEVLRYGSDDSARGDDEPDLPGLADRVKEAIKALDDFAAAWNRSQVILEGASATLMTSASTYARASQQVDEALTGLAGDIAKSSARGAGGIDKALSGLSEEIKTSGTRVARELGSTGDSLNESLDRVTREVDGILDRTGTRFSDLNGKTDVTARALEDLTTKTRAFSNAATEGTTLLTGLQKLVESITNFIRPADARTP
jgi:hypothetical protein